MLSVALVSDAPLQTPATEKPPVTVLTGCLKSSGADTAIAGPSGRLYTLEVVEPPPQTAASSTSAAAPVASKTRYSLSAAESVGLAKHVDHEVRLTGSLQAPSPSTAAKPGAPAKDAPKPGGAHRTFEVTALEMIAAKCK
jgi:hypothetical protein